MVDTEIRQIIKQFVDTLAKKGVRIEQVILYGSYASGNVRPGSDLDLAIVSPDFGKDRFEEGKLLLQTAWRIDPRLQPIPISSEAFEKNTWVPLIHEIREKGIEMNAA
ncbi:MAG: nucleotidyltransferase domain-containing protein [Thermoplasmatales archaeon]|nr:nucleotidyltransferase domain-containing protein [Thermoplasmatales archaeon]